MWTIRLVLFSALVALDRIGILLLKKRDKYQRIVESTLFNTLLVIVGHCICYLTVILPPNGGWNMRPPWLQYASVRIGFPVIGLLLICAGAFLAIATFRQRKVIGVQDVEGGLLTSGMYRYFRHPIWTGILWITLGLPVAMRNPDGLLMVPLIFFFSVIGTIAEEKNDMCIRFPEQYDSYRRTTRMFGPIWVWVALIMSLIALISVGIIM